MYVFGAPWKLGEQEFGVQDGVKMDLILSINKKMKRTIWGLRVSKANNLLYTENVVSLIVYGPLQARCNPGSLAK